MLVEINQQLLPFNVIILGIQLTDLHFQFAILHEKIVELYL